MQRLTLICHGATAATRAGAFPDNEPLEPKALAEAVQLARHLRRADVVLTSPALRTLQTVSALGLPATIDQGLRDWDHGAWRGLALQEVEARWPGALAAWRQDPEAAPPGGEALGVLLRRVSGWMARRSATEGHVIAVTHAAVIRAVLLHVLAAPVASFWLLDIPPFSTTDLRSDGQRWTVRAVGQTLFPAEA